MPKNSDRASARQSLDRRTALGASVAFAALLLPAAAAAGVCDAPWMHDGGEIRMTMQGGAPGTATMSVSGVRKSGKGQCNANISVVSNVAAAGSGNETRLDYTMAVIEDRLTISRGGAPGKVEGKSAAGTASGMLDSSAVGTLAYGGVIEAEGQRLPGESQTVRMDLQMTAAGQSAGQARIPSAKVTIGGKVVGKRATIPTRLGQKSCWPVRYERSTTMAPVTVAGHTVSVPPASASVTDWYCPDMGLVMKQEVVQNGQTGTIEVVSVK
ncbi:hypothetical protein ASL20_06885 [Cupriavidus necator]|uniref:hypothetical protein n=1 Tax=Cupriavidus TaxID=106589 RepID=UPI00032D7C04|nr:MULTISPECIES: hypothetical protein [Cupriavidus]EON21801.1 hypothetical protein C265_01425 [Cupriavidus sp. GA3-3]KUE89631.1 hypothetical protein ASL20_06885 [Cupriavidus necator]